MQSTVTDATSNDERRAHLWALIKGIKFAMFTSRHSNGHLHSRPMTLQNQEMDQTDTLWFYMPRSSETVADLVAEPSVNVSFADPGNDSYVSVAGDAAVVEDPARKQQLWSVMAKAWFPGGPDDPELALIGLRVIHADYWDVKSNQLVQLYKMAKAAVTGDPPSELAEHVKVRMR